MVQHENIGKHLDKGICLIITGPYGKRFLEGGTRY